MKSLIFFLLLTSFFSCGDSNEFKQYDRLLSTLSTANIDLKDYKGIFMIPRQGCGNCVEKAEDFLISYSKSEKTGLLFVLTGRGSEKPLLIKFGPKIMESSDVYVDYENIFQRSPFVSQYPKLFYLENGQIVDLEEINPGTTKSAYARLKKTLN